MDAAVGPSVPDGRRRVIYVLWFTKTNLSVFRSAARKQILLSSRLLVPSMAATSASGPLALADLPIFHFVSPADDFKSELREQLPLIAGSAAAGVVFIVSLVAISIICSR